METPMAVASVHVLATILQPLDATSLYSSATYGIQTLWLQIECVLTTTQPS